MGDLASYIRTHLVDIEIVGVSHGYIECHGPVVLFYAFHPIGTEHGSFGDDLHGDIGSRIDVIHSPTARLGNEKAVSNGDNPIRLEPSLRHGRIEDTTLQFLILEDTISGNGIGNVEIPKPGLDGISDVGEITHDFKVVEKSGIDTGGGQTRVDQLALPIVDVNFEWISQQRPARSHQDVASADGHSETTPFGEDVSRGDNVV
mmetsp:Transcript_25180/g.28164  ORF Transcript_25180/g.28164 Transcript_25180/m.28164 type:complete len:203 (-) Transcript_25180:69-677(-)